VAKPSIGSPPYREKEREKERCYKNHPQSINLANVAPLNINAFFFLNGVNRGTLREERKPLRQARSLSQAGHPDMSARGLYVEASQVEKPDLSVSTSPRRGLTQARGG
jgi:hypothetical protein